MFRVHDKVSRGADIERRDVNLMSPLMWAASEGHADVVKVLIAAGLHDIILFNVCTHARACVSVCV